MVQRILSDEDIEILKRALAKRCRYLGIQPEGAAAMLAADQLLEMFHLGIVDERALTQGPMPITSATGLH